MAELMLSGSRVPGYNKTNYHMFPNEEQVGSKKKLLGKEKFAYSEIALHENVNRRSRNAFSELATV